MTTFVVTLFCGIYGFLIILNGFLLIKNVIREYRNFAVTYLNNTKQVWERERERERDMVARVLIRAEVSFIDRV